jgi:hypothetical protein
MSWASLSDLIRPIGSVYFSLVSSAWNFSPVDLFGGTWVNSGTIVVSDSVFNVWHRTE